MDPKKFFTNKSMCVLPWTGFELDPGGYVKNCIMSKEYLGNIQNTPIQQIMNGEVNLRLKDDMLNDKKPTNCSGCHMQEKNRNDLSSISSRLYYLREIGAKSDLSIYDNKKNFKLRHVDLRWTNSCNQACVYCEPMLSSKWAQELGTHISSDKKSRQDVKNFVFDNIANLQNVYLAGGEPMLMKENLEFLQLLKEKNPDCAIRINTNLSTTRTGVFDLVRSFKNVHWIVSIETIEEQYEYVRYHGSWRDFVQNLNTIKQLNHKISFNMLHFILNYDSLFDCVNYLKGIGFHDNSFIIGPLTKPDHLNILNLPDHMIDRLKKKLHLLIQGSSNGYLKNSFENLLKYYTTTTWTKNLLEFHTQTKIMDRRRGNDCRRAFPLLFEELDAETLE